MKKVNAAVTDRKRRFAANLEPALPRWLGLAGMLDLPAKTPPRAAEPYKSATTWVCVALGVAVVLAAIALSIFGVAEKGSSLALRVTARWSFLLFWLAYVGRPLEQLFGSLFRALARRRRELGLAFASSMIVHVCLVIWLFYISAGPGGTMALFWSGIVVTYLLALLSFPIFRKVCPTFFLPGLFTIGTDFIAYVFATDFILSQLDGLAFMKHLSYLPFALMLVCGVTLRLFVFTRRSFTHLKALYARRKGALSLRAVRTNSRSL